MIVIQKKRILTLVSIICITLFVASIKVDKQEETIATVAIPVTNKVIVVDARASVNQMKERKVVQVQLKLKQI